MSQARTMGADKSKDLRLSPLELPLPCMYIGRRQLDIGAHLRERICEGGEKGMIQLQPLHDRVVIGKYGGTDVIIDDEEYLIMRENEIFGRIGKVEKTKTARK